MPSEKILEAKKQQVAELKERLDGSVAGVLVNYSGISVADDTKLRKELRENGVSDFTLTIDTKLGPDKDGEYSQFVFKTYRYSERRSYITVNGHGEFFILRNFVDKIIKSSKDIFDNVLIDSSNRY